MKNTSMLLEMLVAITTKEDLIDEAITSLQNLKVNMNNNEVNKHTALCCLKVFFKVEQNNKSIQEVLSDSEETNKIMETAIEFSKMTKDLNKE